TWEAEYMTRNTKDWSGLEAYVKTIMEREQIPGLAMAISQHGETIYEQGFGVRDIETNKRVTPDTIFGIASVTKSFTALAIMQLVEQGKLTLDSPVIRYLPQFHLPRAKDMEQIYVHHLLTHTTGQPP